MAIISSYPYNVTVQDSDSWIGTDSDRKTKQYTASALAQFLNANNKIDIGVKTVTSGSGIVLTGTAADPIVSVKYATGSDNLIQGATESTSISGGGYSAYILKSESNPNVPNGAVEKIRISDIPLNSLGSPTANFSFGNKKLTNLAAPTSDNDAATRAYVDSETSLRVQSVTGGDGVSVTGSSATPAVAVDYSTGADNLIQSATATTNISIDSNFGPYILKSESDPGTPNGVVEKIRLNDISLSAFDSPIYNLSLNNKKITLLDSPSIGTDAANKAYVDSETSLTVQSVTGGNGISVTGSSTTPTVAVDYSEGADNLIQAATATNNVALGTAGDYILKSKSNPYGTNQAVEKIRLNDITLSAFASPTLDFSFGSKKITNLNSPSNSTDAANKAYVDAAIVGGLFYQGGYNASTNTPVIDTSGTLSIGALGSGGGPLTGTFPATTTSGSGSGMTIYVQLNSFGSITTARVVDRGSGYTVGSTVSVADAISGHTGSYFTIQNIPLANVKKGFTYTVTADGTFFGEQLRIGDVLIAESNDPSSVDDWTTVQNNIDIASATQVGIGNVVAGTDMSVSYANGTATLNNTFTSPASSASGTISIGQTSGTVTHAFGTNVMVQTYKTGGETVFCEIDRTSTTVTATIGSSISSDINIIVHKIT
jgi:hypothetical protein